MGSHSDCMVSWDTVGGIQALGCLQGPLQTGFGVTQDGPVAILAVLQGKFCLVACRGVWGLSRFGAIWDEKPPGKGGMVFMMFPDGSDAFWAL